MDTCQSRAFNKSGVSFPSVLVLLIETKKDIKIDMIRITAESQVPMAVHGTNLLAWKHIGKAQKTIVAFWMFLSAIQLVRVSVA